ncbi:hypothetical protein EK0264_19105 [Epidermidibacterium keratini]|uniref:N-terminal of MaoC-like dehydratase domain-containing protein n=1 Tax=Epidermidibacterium keratini TaxID=1891644 RepID=A0A7L4YSL4_9ACTN|nr:hypothetical protein [Epidermidibacterium keratini]QHC02166.1 hypothetical protein EK0264_19105 [Epidermidibacterium keratini]
MDEHPLAQYVEQWHPEPAERRAVIDLETAVQLGDILDFEAPTSGVLPPLWQWGYFHSWPRLPGLGADGHPVEDAFQPPIPGRRRMWAGGSVQVRRPLSIGQEATCRGELVSAVPKSGRTGAMILATVRYEYSQQGQTCIVEEQNHVYRGADDGSAPDWGARPSALPTSDAPWQHAMVTDPIRLFRMSALTANSHRIHYDRPYAQDVEGYVNLVVHGPLLAMQLGVLAARFDPRLELTRFDYRVQAPVFVGEPVLATGGPASAQTELAVISEGGRAHVAATAAYAETQQ